MPDTEKIMYNKKKRTRNKSRKWIIAGIVAATAVACAAGAGIWWLNSIRHSRGFLPGTTVNGIGVSGKTPEEVTSFITQQFKEGEAILYENGRQVFASPLSELGYAIDTKDLSAALQKMEEEEKKDLRSVISSLMEEHAYETEIRWTSNEGQFRSAVTSEALSEPRVKNTNAKILYYRDEKECRIEPEVQGTEIKDGALQDWLGKELDKTMENGAKDMAAAESDNAPYIFKSDIPKDLYTRPDKCADDDAVKEKCAILNRYAKESITYTFGNSTETIDFSTIMGWIRVRNGEVEIKEEKLREYAASLGKKYDTRYLDRTFTTSRGDTKTIPGDYNLYGYTVDEDSEIQQLKQDILSGGTITREPVYFQTNPWGNPYYCKREGEDDLAGTYVEVSIKDQHMWFYKDGDLVVESDVVTGDATNGHDTAKGAFPLAFKESPSILRGDGADRYETKVQYWMPFYEGQGLHDAWWKSVFGGNEYKGNGSHGCVNLPTEIAEKLYKNIEPGTAIIIY